MTSAAHRFRCCLAIATLTAFICAPAHAALSYVQYAELSEAVYNAGTPAPAGFILIDHVKDSNSGFEAAAYQSRATQEIVVSYAGTQNMDDAVADLGVAGTHIRAAEKIVVEGLERILPGAEKKLAKYMDEAAAVVLRPTPQLVAQLQEGQQFRDRVAAANKGKPITLTGHSLGGYIAQYVSVKTATAAVTFNGPGAAGYTGTDSGNVINCIRKYDMVGPLGRHVGRIVLYPEVKLKLADIKERYVMRNHQIANFRSDLASGMNP